MLSFSDLEQIQRLMTKAFKEHKDIDHNKSSDEMNGDCCNSASCECHHKYISFDTFDAYLQNIEDVAHAMSDLNNIGVDISDSVLNSTDVMINMLSALMHDEEDIISWYCWELNFGADGEEALTLGDELCDLTCAEELYEYLTT